MTDQATPGALGSTEVLGPLPERDIDGEPYTAERVAHWLDAKYSRHGEDDDRAAAALVRRQAAEIDRQRNELREGDDLRERMADILSRTAIALRGPEPPLTRRSWHDLPELAADAIAAVAAERERIARQWDGCIYAVAGAGAVDIGAEIRGP